MQIRQTQKHEESSFNGSPVNWAFFFGSVFFVLVNLFASIAIFPGYSLAIGSTPFQAGLQNTVFGMAAITLRFFLGPVMDRQGPKPLMLLGIFSFATAPLLLVFSSSYSMLLLARVYQSLGLAVCLPGIFTLTAEMAPRGRIGTFLGASRIFINLGLLAGPGGALLIIEQLGYNHWFIVSAVTNAAALGLLAAVNVPAVSLRTEKIAGSWSQIQKALSEKQVYPIIASIALFSFTYSGVVSFAAVHIETAAPGVEAALFFFFFGLSGIASCLGAGVISDRLGRRKTAWPLLVTVGIGAIAFYFIPFAAFLVVLCGLIFGIGIQGSSLVFGAWLIDISTPDVRATRISLQENTVDIMFAVGALVFGAAAGYPGLGFAFLTAGLITVAAVIPLYKAAAALTKNRG